MTCTVQFIGSIVAWARNGISKCGLDRVAIVQTLAPHRRGSWRRRPSRSLAALMSFQIAAESTFAFGAVVPGDIERFEALFCGPEMIADDGHQIVEHDDLAHAGNGFGARRRRRAPTLPPNTGLGGDRGELHARRQHVDAVERFAVDLVGRVEPLERSCRSA